MSEIDPRIITAVSLENHPDEDVVGLVDALNELLDTYPVLLQVLATFPDDCEIIRMLYKATWFLQEWGDKPDKMGYFKYHVNEQGKYILDAVGLESDRKNLGQ